MYDVAETENTKIENMIFLDIIWWGMEKLEVKNFDRKFKK